MSALVAEACRAHTFDTATKDLSQCQRSAGYMVTINSDCAGETQREVCDAHLCALKAGSVKCIDGRHIVWLVSAQRVGGAPI